MVQFLNTATLSASKLASTDSQVWATDSTTDKNIFCQSLLRCGCPTGFSRLLTGVYYGDDGDGVTVVVMMVMVAGLPNRPLQATDRC